MPLSLFSFGDKESAVAKKLTEIDIDDQGLSLKDLFQCDITIKGKALQLQLELGMPIRRLESQLRSRIQEALGGDFEQVNVTMSWRSPDTQSMSSHKPVPGVRNVVAIASGKGGVGKSTTAVNLALALAESGARVGVLDADIYGPSQSAMLGLEGKRPEIIPPNTMKPLEGLAGVQMMGMGNLVTESTPMIWRGPMVSGAFQQLLNSTAWDDVDYLIVDMPPGTGDVQLTLSQSVAVSGAVIITTPQDIALLDARKGIEMFKQVSVPVLGVVENMSIHTCSQCGHEDAIFGSKGGEALAKEYGVGLLQRLPLQASICEQTDRGCPPVIADPDSSVSERYFNLAQSVAAALWKLEIQGSSAPEISVSDD